MSADLRTQPARTSHTDGCIGPVIEQGWLCHMQFGSAIVRSDPHTVSAQEAADRTGYGSRDSEGKQTAGPIGPAIRSTSSRQEGLWSTSSSRRSIGIHGTNVRTPISILSHRRCANSHVLIQCKARHRQQETDCANVSSERSVRPLPFALPNDSFCGRVPVGMIRYRLHHDAWLSWYCMRGTGTGTSSRRQHHSWSE